MIAASPRYFPPLAQGCEPELPSQMNLWRHDSVIGLLPPTTCGLDRRRCSMLWCGVVGLVVLVGGGWWIEWRIQTQSRRACRSSFLWPFHRVGPGKNRRRGLGKMPPKAPAPVSGSQAGNNSLHRTALAKLLATSGSLMTLSARLSQKPAAAKPAAPKAAAAKAAAPKAAGASKTAAPKSGLAAAAAAAAKPAAAKVAAAKSSTASKITT